MSNNGSSPKRKRIEETFTFKSTGVNVTYTRVPLQLIIDFESGWKRKNPAPPIPMVETDIGGEKRMIENPTDPTYQTATAVWEREIHVTSYRYVLKKSIVLSTEDISEVTALRTEIAEANSELDKDDFWVFLFNIAGEEPTEIEEFQNTILRLSQPTEAAIADAKARFPDKV